MVPGARAELAWISPKDFEFLLNPASRYNFDETQGLELSNLSMAAYVFISHKRTKPRRLKPFPFRLFPKRVEKGSNRLYSHGYSIIFNRYFLPTTRRQFKHAVFS
ncbi:MAG TPA: hypothetical protein DCZ41_03860 [Firmicutes bacterium]|nr:hypothetical protein [Bacillota bacterium]